MQDVQDKSRDIHGRPSEDFITHIATEFSSGDVGEADWEDGMEGASDYTIEDWVGTYARWEDDRWLNLQYSKGTWHGRLQSRVGGLIAFATAHGTLQNVLDTLQDKLLEMMEDSTYGEPDE
jgi:hypothetical protein